MFGGFSSCFIEHDEYESDNSLTGNGSDNETSSGEADKCDDCQSDQPTAKKTKKS